MKRKISLFLKNNRVVLKKMHCAGFFKIFFLIFKNSIKNECQASAALLTFNTLLALVPLLVTIFVITSFFPMYDEASIKMENFIFTTFVPATGALLQDYFEEIYQNVSQLSFLGVSSLFVTAVLLIYTIESAFNKIFYVSIQRNQFKAFLIYSAVLILMPLFIGIVLVFFSKFSIFLFLNEKLDDFFPIFLIFLFFTALYQFVPNTKIYLKASLLGGLFSSIFFIGCKIIFIWYIRHFDSFQILYGTLSVIPLFLIWIYSLWFIVLLGAEMVAAINPIFEKSVDKSIKIK